MGGKEKRQRPTEGRWSSTSAFQVPRSTFHEEKNGVPRRFWKPLIERPLQLGRKTEIRSPKSKTGPKFKPEPFSTPSASEEFLHSERQ